MKYANITVISNGIIFSKDNKYRDKIFNSAAEPPIRI